MNLRLQQDLDDLAVLLDKAKLQSLEHLQSISELTTTPSKQEQPEKLTLPEYGIGGSDTLDVFNERFKAIMVATAGPRYLGFVTGGTTPAAIMGDWLVTAYDQNTFATTGQGDISALIELETISLFLELLGLPNSFLGGFVTGATMSNFTCLAVARQWAGKAQNLDIAKDGMSGQVNIYSATPHSSSIKSLSMLGMGSNNIIKVKTLEGNREAMDVAALENHLAAAGDTPCIVISSAGTVNTVDFDDMQAIANLKTTYNFWWHIDAAFGAFAACSPEHGHLLTGWDKADSITVDCHKWMNVPYDSAVFFIKETYKNLQVETFQNSNAPYLGDPLANFSYLNLLPENSRRLRALPAWFNLMAYGKEGYREIVENSIALARELGALIAASKDFELLAPVRLNNVCFSLSPSLYKPEMVPLFLSRLNQGGKVFMTPTVYNGTPGVRAAFVNWRSTENDISIIFNEMMNALDAAE